MHVFNAEHAASLGGPDWLQERRRAAATDFADLPWPTAEDEVWRYSPVADIDVGTYTPCAKAGSGPVDPDWLDATNPSVVVRMASGFLQSIEQRGQAPSGLTVERVADVDTDPFPAGADRHDVVTSFAAAFSADPLLITVSAGTIVPGPVVILHHLDASASAEKPPAIASLVRVVVGADAEVSVIEHRTSSTGAALTVPAVEIDVAQAARVRYTDVQRLGSATVQLGHHVASVEQSATLTMILAAFGGGYARMRTDCRLVGRGATGNMAALYFGAGDQTLDFRTFQEHHAADTTSDLLYKGVIDDHSRSVYSGLIRVGAEGRGTNAFQTNRNIKLSPDAWAESVPNLEIEHNEVRCSHASTVGPIDQDQQFYLESRGVRPEDAERLVVAGFFEEVIQKTDRDGLAATLRASVADKLGARQLVAHSISEVQ